MASEVKKKKSLERNLEDKSQESEEETSGEESEETLTKLKDHYYDYAEIREQFINICPDFVNCLDLEESDPENEQGFQSLDFSMMVLYEISPFSALFPQENCDRVWSLEFQKLSDQDVTKTVNIVSENYEAEPLESKFEKNEIIMTLTIPQAILLAMEKFNSLVETAYHTRNEILFSPLASVFFDVNHVPKIAEKLNESVVVTTKMINASCQEDGHFLENSDAAFAKAAMIVSTKKDPEIIRKFFIHRITSLYEKAGKTLSESRFQIAMSFVSDPVINESGSENNAKDRKEKVLETSFENHKIKINNDVVKPEDISNNEDVSTNGQEKEHYGTNISEEKESMKGDLENQDEKTKNDIVRKKNVDSSVNT